MVGLQVRGSSDSVWLLPLGRAKRAWKDVDPWPFLLGIGWGSPRLSFGELKRSIFVMKTDSQHEHGGNRVENERAPFRPSHTPSVLRMPHLCPSVLRRLPGDVPSSSSIR